MTGLFNLVDNLLQNEDLANKCLLGRVVRLQEDEEAIKTRSVSVLTEQGLLFKDVVVTQPSPYSQSFPHIPEDIDLQGSYVIIAFLNGSIKQPFILRYVMPNTYPGVKSSAYTAILSLLYTCIQDDQDGTTSISFSKESHSVLLNFTGSNSSIKIATPYLVELFSNNLSLDIRDTITLLADKYIRELSELKDKVEKLELKWKEFELESDKAKIKVDKVEVDSDELKGTIDTIDLEANQKVNIKSKNINLSSDSPSDSPVLFSQLQQILQELLTALSTLTVTCSAPGSASTPPLNFAQFISLSQRLINIKSKYIKID